MSPAIDGEKRANWNWSGRSTIEILAYCFLKNKQISVLTFLVAENIEKLLDTRGLGNLVYYYCIRNQVPLLCIRHISICWDLNIRIHNIVNYCTSIVLCSMVESIEKNYQYVHALLGCD